MGNLTDFIRGIPKAEMHVHIEGTIEPRMMFDLAARNGVTIKWESPEALQAALEFRDLQSFLDVYFEGCRVLLHQQDFYDVTKAYLKRAHEDNVVRAELFLGPQSFTERTPLAKIMEGVFGAIDDARSEFGIHAALMVSTHRHRTEDDAFVLLESIMPWRDRVLAIGMGGPELPNPPSKFERYFKECRARGFKTCIHAGEEGPAEYVRQALELLEVDRIDHGNACLGDDALVHKLAERGIGLTVCPVSNQKLGVVSDLAEHPLRKLIDAGLMVSINSDDPPYFNAYVNDNFIQCQRALGLTREEIIVLARNSLSTVFAPQVEIDGYLRRLDEYCAKNAPIDIVDGRNRNI